MYASKASIGEGVIVENPFSNLNDIQYAVYSVFSPLAMILPVDHLDNNDVLQKRWPS